MAKPRVRGDRNGVLHITGYAGLQTQVNGELIDSVLLSMRFSDCIYQLEPFCIVRARAQKHAHQIVDVRSVLKLVPNGPRHQQGNGPCSRQSSGVGMCDAGNGSYKIIQSTLRLGKQCSDRRHTHSGPVACRCDAAAGGSESEPQSQDCPQRPKTNAGGQREEPPAERPRQASLEPFERIRVSDETLGDKEGVFRVVADHAAVQDETMAPAAFEEFLRAAPRDSFRWKPQRVTNGCADQCAANAVATCKTVSHED